MGPVLKLQQITVNDRERVGGKAFALATMVERGLKVLVGSALARLSHESTR